MSLIYYLTIIKYILMTYISNYNPQLFYNKQIIKDIKKCKNLKPHSNKQVL